MGLLDWLFGEDEPNVQYTQSPQQQAVWNALLPMIQRIGGAGSNPQPNQFISNWNKGVNPWTQKAMNTRPVNLPTTSQSYGNQMSPQIKEKLIAAMNKKRLLNNQNPIIMR